MGVSVCLPADSTWYRFAVECMGSVSSNNVTVGRVSLSYVLYHMYIQFAFLAHSIDSKGTAMTILDPGSKPRGFTLFDSFDSIRWNS